jgi:hypothetical protein
MEPAKEHIYNNGSNEPSLRKIYITKIQITTKKELASKYG